MRKSGPYKVTGVTNNTPQILRDRLKNTISIHRRTLSSMRRRHCDDDMANRDEQYTKKEPNPEGETDKYRREGNSTYVIKSFARHFGSGLPSGIWCDRMFKVRSTTPPNAATTYSSIIPKRTGNDLKNEKRSYSKPFKPSASPTVTPAKTFPFR